MENYLGDINLPCPKRQQIAKSQNECGHCVKESKGEGLAENHRRYTLIAVIDILAIPWYSVKV